MSSGAELIAAERLRQMESEGWVPEHDDEHLYGELLAAARCYAEAAAICENAPVALKSARRGYERAGVPLDQDYERQSENPARHYFGWDEEPKNWPSEWSGWWKPAPDPIRNLVKAGALIAAEIDRLLRAGGDADAR